MGGTGSGRGDKKEEVIQVIWNNLPVELADADVAGMLFIFQQTLNPEP
jgi:hypothetical protein